MSGMGKHRPGMDAGLAAVGVAVVALIFAVLWVHSVDGGATPGVGGASAGIVSHGASEGARYASQSDVRSAVLGFGPEPLRLDTCAPVEGDRVGPCVYQAKASYWLYLADDMAPGSEILVPSCPTEDSLGCVWDPMSMGNRASGERGNKILLFGYKTIQE